MNLRKLILIVILGLPVAIHAQGHKWFIYPSIAIDMGGTIPFPFSDIPKGASGTPKLNPNLGLGFGYNISEKWNLGVEISYHILAFSSVADIRSQSHYTIYFSGHTITDVELRFIELPIVASYTINPKWTLTLGAYYSPILEGTFNATVTKGVWSPNKIITDTTSFYPNLDQPLSYSYSEFIGKWDAGVLIGYSYNLNHRINFWGRLHVGLKSIFVKGFNDIKYEMYQVRLNAGISVILFSNKKDE